jgi:hypothetical protein
VRHVIVENVAVLDEAARPTPDHVQMLRFVAVEAETKQVREF